MARRARSWITSQFADIESSCVAAAAMVAVLVGQLLLATESLLDVTVPGWLQWPLLVTPSAAVAFGQAKRHRIFHAFIGILTALLVVLLVGLVAAAVYFAFYPS